MELLRHPLPADLITPLSAYLALRPFGASLLLESADRGEQVGRYSFVLIEGHGQLRLDPPGMAWKNLLRQFHGKIHEPLLEHLDPEAEIPAPREKLPIGVGSAGYLGFEALGALEPTLKLPLRNTLALPTVWFKHFEGALVFDHLHQVAEFQLLTSKDRRVLGLETLRHWAHHLFARPTPATSQTFQSQVANPLISQATFEKQVQGALNYIRDGDVYQLVPSQRFCVAHPPSPLSAYRRLRRINPSPYAFLLEWENFALVGASPEMLVRVHKGEAETLPIAGTIPRGKGSEEDTQRFERLRGDSKELAEHQMLVDLARNDLGRVAATGGVRVERPLALQRTSHVLHLTTTVKAQLKPDIDAIDVLASVFPAGTVSGAPKIRACQRIAEMEGDMRGPYGGALVRLGIDGVLDSALILRTAIYSGAKAYIQAGAGVVRASKPRSEYEETLHKAQAVAEALGAVLPGTTP